MYFLKGRLASHGMFGANDTHNAPDGVFVERIPPDAHDHRKHSAAGLPHIVVVMSPARLDRSFADVCVAARTFVIFPGLRITFRSHEV